MNKERDFDDEIVELSDEDLEKVDGGYSGNHSGMNDICLIKNNI